MTQVPIETTSKPVEAQSAEIQTIEHQPIQSEPIQSEPVQNQTIQSDSIQNRPIQTEFIHTQTETRAAATPSPVSPIAEGQPIYNHPVEEIPGKNPFGDPADAPPAYAYSDTKSDIGSRAHSVVDGDDRALVLTSRSPDTIERDGDGPAAAAAAAAGTPPNASPARKGRSIGERFHRLSSATGRPINMVAHAIGAEGPWPDTLGRECSKAARILYSFTGLKYDAPSKKGGPLHPTGLTKKSVVKIPPKVLQSCHGLAIFNTVRAGGFHGSLSGGSGIVVARRSDGTWSPPSAFLVSTLGAGFMIGLDVYDCVCVLNTPGQVAAFTRPRLSLGGNIGVTMGPVGTGSALNSALAGSDGARPAWSYMKSRGLFAGIQVDGTVFVGRGDANAVFYGEKGISVERILHGDVAWPVGAKPLFEVLKLIDGRGDVDQAVVEDVMGEAPPSPPVGPVMTPTSGAPPTFETGFPVEKQPLQQQEQLPQVTGQQSSNDALTLGERRKDGDDDDLYSTSAVDEKERLAKSGY